jgi:hypothetical protein
MSIRDRTQAKPNVTLDCSKMRRKRTGYSWHKAGHDDNARQRHD